MKIYNTMTRKKEEFVPIRENEVSMYSCGPTVYNLFHIGNARPFIIFDTLRKYFEYRGYQVKFVQNFTDIDDKMIKKANEEGITVSEVADKYIDEYYIDAKGLGISAATHHPKATEHMEEIITLIQDLVQKGFAYEVSGDVYFNTRNFKDYGKLSQQALEDLTSGVRIEVDSRKKDPMDFALWKAQKPGEPAWASPWGMGRPGWHVECSAMATKYLGETIDIHSGGQDLIFPHHENEIAQSEAASGKPFARYWMHNGFINVNNEKMAKSAGNFFMVRDVVSQFDYSVIRFFMLSAHYRSPINFSAELLEQSKNGLERIANCVSHLKHLKEHGKRSELTQEEQPFVGTLEKLKTKFVDAMDDDLNTADALAAIFDMVREINSYFADHPKATDTLIGNSLASIRELSDVLGITVDNQDVVDTDIDALIQNRQQARADKNWKLADEIRDTLKAMNITLEDTPQGVKWKRT